MLTRVDTKSILRIFSDGGPDHSLTYVSVLLSLIALFLNLDLDFLIACRTAPNHSWRNPVERMSVINLGFQSVGVMRSKGSDDFEASIHNCNSLKELRTACTSPRDLSQCLHPATDLLNSILHQLELEGKAFDTYDAADDNEIEAFWEVLQQVDETLTSSDTTKKAIKDKAALTEFLNHCCRLSHYSFQVKKSVGNQTTICKPVRMDPVVFSSIHFLPNLVPGVDDHYMSFQEAYGQPTSDKHRPSLQLKKRKEASFSPSQQHVKNVGLLLQCEECDKWRLLFCKHKLNIQEVCDLQKILDDVM